MSITEDHGRLIQWIPDAKGSDLCEALLMILREHYPLEKHVFHQDSTKCPDHSYREHPELYTGAAAREHDRQTYIDCPTCVTEFRDTCASRNCMSCDGWPCPVVRTIQEAIL